MSSDIPRARLNDYQPAITYTPSTTASQNQQTWHLPPASAGQTPQPVFTQDFELFHSSATTTQAQQASHRRAPSLDSTLTPSFNTANSTGLLGNVDLRSVQTIDSTQRNQRSTRPQVPLFHSNSTGSLANQNSSQQYHQVTDISAFEMGGGGNSTPTMYSHESPLTMSAEINVAYDGTFGDLGSARDASLFNVNGNMDFNAFLGTTDGFTAINDGRTHGVTVSPKDVFNTDSIPPSTSFTNLTTPGSTLLETPDEDYQTSPLFSDNFGPDNHGADQWYSLFTDDNGPTNTIAPFMARTTSGSSANQVVVHPGGEGNRKRTSTIAASPAPFSPAVKHSTVAGVNARKRDKPLPPIVADEEDPVAMKRARNTAAARKSREKKVMVHEKLEAQVADLESENANLKAEVEHWKLLALGQHVNLDSSDE